MFSLKNKKILSGYPLLPEAMSVPTVTLRQMPHLASVYHQSQHIRQELSSVMSTRWHQPRHRVITEKQTVTISLDNFGIQIISFFFMLSFHRTYYLTRSIWQFWDTFYKYFIKTYLVGTHLKDLIILLGWSFLFHHKKCMSCAFIRSASIRCF